MQVRTLLDALGLVHISDGYLSGVWDIYDTNGDGVLDLEEVQDMVEILDTEKPEQLDSSDEEDD